MESGAQKSMGIDPGRPVACMRVLEVVATLSG